MLAITKSLKINDEMYKILKYLHKIWFSKELMIKTTPLQQSETMSQFLYFYTKSLDWKRR